MIYMVKINPETVELLQNESEKAKRMEGAGYEDIRKVIINLLFLKDCPVILVQESLYKATVVNVKGDSFEIYKKYLVDISPMNFKKFDLKIEKLKEMSKELTN